MLLLLGQRVLAPARLYTISLQRLFYAKMLSRCCCSFILKIFHVFAFHKVQASRLYLFTPDIVFFPFYCNSSCTIVLFRFF